MAPESFRHLPPSACFLGGGDVAGTEQMMGEKRGAIEMPANAKVDWAKARLGLRGTGGRKLGYKDRGGGLAAGTGSIRQLILPEMALLPLLLFWPQTPQRLSSPPGDTGRMGRMFGFRNGSLVWGRLKPEATPPKSWPCSVPPGSWGAGSFIFAL